MAVSQAEKIPRPAPGNWGPARVSAWADAAAGTEEGQSETRIFQGGLVLLAPGVPLAQQQGTFLDGTLASKGSYQEGETLEQENVPFVLNHKYVS